MAGEPLASIVRDVGPDHIASYYLVLHGWMTAAGQTEFGLRSMSLMFAVLMVAALMKFTRRLLGPGPELLAGLMASANPFLLYHAQETRMYGMLLMFALLALLSFTRLTHSAAPRWLWPAYSLSVAAVLYTHYYGILLLPALAVAPAFLRPRFNFALKNALSLAVSVLLFAPWAIYRRDVFFTFKPITSATLTFGRLLSDFLIATHVGEASFELREQLVWQPLPWLLAGACLALALCGIALDRRRIRERLFLVVLWLAPLAMIAALTLGRRDFTPRYASIALTGYLPLVGAGLWALRRWFWPALLAADLVLAVDGFFVHAYFTDPAFQRQDFRGAIAYTLARSTPGDTTILLASYLEPIWRYYSHNALAPTQLPPPITLSQSQLDVALQGATAPADRVHLFLWQDYAEDPDGRTLTWLRTRRAQVDGHGFRQITVYDFARTSVFSAQPPSGMTANGTAFSGQLRLIGYREQPLVGGGVRLDLVWQRLAPIGQELHAFAHLVRQGQDVAVADHRPGFDMVDLRRWDGSQLLVDEYDLSDAGPAPDGVQIGLYDPSSGNRLEPATLSLPYSPR
ncbi:MAG: glycosyltransferase family 39 protein [Chloroflexi bacterium]|nr:glycosyltransferase family 39 protein [Chloroflexota bacterium]